MSQIMGAGGGGGALIPANFADSPNPGVSLNPTAGTAITAKRSDEILALDPTAAYAFSGLGNTTLGGTSILKVPNGSASNPSITFTGSPTTGIWQSGGQVAFSNSGILQGYFGSNGLLNLTNNGLALGASSNTGVLRFGTNGDTILSYGGIAKIQFGDANAATPVAQTFKVQDALTGNNNGAATFTLQASASVGNGTSGDMVFQTGKNGNGSGVLATQTTALTIKGETQSVIIAAGKTLQLGATAVTGLVAGALAALTNASLTLTDSTGTVYRIPCVTP